MQPTAAAVTPPAENAVRLPAGAADTAAADADAKYVERANFWGRKNRPRMTIHILGMARIKRASVKMITQGIVPQTRWAENGD